jgi:hypothetical protein
VSVARAHPSYLASAFPHAGTIFLLASAPARALGEGEMTANVLFRIFTIEIGDTPTLMFEAQNMREAQELCHEQWLKDDRPNPWCPVVGWQGQVSGTDGAARRERPVCRGQE